MNVLGWHGRSPKRGTDGAHSFDLTGSSVCKRSQDRRSLAIHREWSFPDQCHPSSLTNRPYQEEGLLAANVRIGSRYTESIHIIERVACCWSHCCESRNQALILQILMSGLRMNWLLLRVYRMIAEGRRRFTRLSPEKKKMWHLGKESPWVTWVRWRKAW